MKARRGSVRNVEVLVQRECYPSTQLHRLSVLSPSNSVPSARPSLFGIEENQDRYLELQHSIVVVPQEDPIVDAWYIGGHERSSKVKEISAFGTQCRVDFTRSLAFWLPKPHDNRFSSSIDVGHDGDLMLFSLLSFWLIQIASTHIKRGDEPLRSRASASNRLRVISCVRPSTRIGRVS
jgi:hypothetical protein